MELNDKQKEIITSNKSQIVVAAAAASGKAQPNETIIPTPDGYKTIGELKPGDKVFNRFGKEEKIIGIFPQGEQEVYKVTLADGRTTECCGEHLWAYDNFRGNLAKKTTKEMYESKWVEKDKRGHNRYKYRIPVLKNAVEYPEKDFVIHPYVLGAFIGDGCCTEQNLTLSSLDEWLVNKIATLCNFKYKRRSEHNYSWDFFDNGIRIKTNDFFKNYNNEICCYCQEKSIPKDYLLGSVEQRMMLLQGLMDTDGTTGDGKNSPSYATNSKRLAYNVLELIRSLGFYGQIFVNDRRKTGKNIEYTVNIFTGNENTNKIFSLPRKVEKSLSFKDKKQHIKHNFVSIVNIEKTDIKKEMTCIYVDDFEHLYLTNDFIVTHNTTVLIERIKFLLNSGINPNNIVAITFTNAAADNMRERLGHSADGMFIGTLHSYANFLLISRGIDTTKIIEKEEFDKFFELIKENLDCVRPVGHLLLDEAQDSTPLQFEFIFDLVKPNNYFIVGDWKQSIYQWNGADPSLLLNLTKKNFVTTYSLNQNYRNARYILSFAKNIIHLAGTDYEDYSIPMCQNEGKVINVTYSSDNICNTLKKYGNYKEWFVLARTNRELELITWAFDKYNIPYDTFKRADLSKSDFEKVMAKDSVKALTIHAAKGLESPNVIVIGAKMYNLEEKCISYVAATRAKNLLVWTSTPKKRDRIKTMSWE